MSKKLYYQLSDNADVSQIVMSLDEVKIWIEEDLKGVSEADSKEFEYTITPVYLSERQFKNLHEASF